MIDVGFEEELKRIEARVSSIDNNSVKYRNSYISFMESKHTQKMQSGIKIESADICAQETAEKFSPIEEYSHEPVEYVCSAESKTDTASSQDEMLEYISVMSKVKELLEINDFQGIVEVCEQTSENERCNNSSFIINNMCLALWQIEEYEKLSAYADRFLALNSLEEDSWKPYFFKGTALLFLGNKVIDDTEKSISLMKEALAYLDEALKYARIYLSSGSEGMIQGYRAWAILYIDGITDEYKVTMEELKRHGDPLGLANRIESLLAKIKHDSGIDLTDNSESRVTKDVSLVSFNMNFFVKCIGVQGIQETYCNLTEAVFIKEFLDKSVSIKENSYSLRESLGGRSVDEGEIRLYDWNIPHGGSLKLQIYEYSPKQSDYCELNVYCSCLEEERFEFKIQINRAIDTLRRIGVNYEESM